MQFSVISRIHTFSMCGESYLSAGDWDRRFKASPLFFTKILGHSWIISSQEFFAICLWHIITTQKLFYHDYNALQSKCWPLHWQRKIFLLVCINKTLHICVYLIFISSTSNERLTILLITIWRKIFKKVIHNWWIYSK